MSSSITAEVQESVQSNQEIKGARGNGFVNREVWWDIEKNLGTVTNFEIVLHENLTEIKYICKLGEKSIYVGGSDPHASMTHFIQSYLYCMKEWNV
jgi:hypothetical protein